MLNDEHCQATTQARYRSTFVVLFEMIKNEFCSAFVNYFTKRTRNWFSESITGILNNKYYQKANQRPRSHYIHSHLRYNAIVWASNSTSRGLLNFRLFNDCRFDVVLQYNAYFVIKLADEALLLDLVNTLDGQTYC